MRIEILRTYKIEETLGDLIVYSDDKVILTEPPQSSVIFSCKTLEPADRGNKRNISCIPEGTYTVVRELTSPGHAYPHFRVLNVPARNGILWHGGNYFKDTLGCLLVGDSFGDRNKDGILDVLNSRATLQKLYDLLPDKFECTYKKK